jgi:hypothetical protein
MVNLTLAVINNKVTEAHAHFEEQTKIQAWQRKHLHKVLSFRKEDLPESNNGGAQ